MAPQLVAAGVGELVGIDYQRFDRGNRLSNDTVSWVDLAIHRTKLAAIICDVLQMVLGYAPSKAFVVYKKYDGFSGTVTDWEVSHRDGCHHCGGTVASGDAGNRAFVAAGT